MLRGLFLLLFVCGVADAAPKKVKKVVPAPVAVEGAVVAADLHTAARFFAHLYETSIVVLGGDDKTLSFELVTDARTAIPQLAKQGALTTAQKQGLWVLAPKDLIGRTEPSSRRPLQPGKPVDLDFQLVDGELVLKLLADVLKLGKDGRVGGRISIVCRGCGALTLVGVLTRLAGREASRIAGRLLVAGGFPPAPELGPPACPTESMVHAFDCLDASGLEVLAWGKRGEHAHVVLRPRAAKAEERTAPRVVGLGQRVGKAGATLSSVAKDGATLSDGTKIPLAAAPAG